MAYSTGRLYLRKDNREIRYDTIRRAGFGLLIIYGTEHKKSTVKNYHTKNTNMIQSTEEFEQSMVTV